ncbi:L-threonylcarbamoyladenylate synthase [Candidatus Babeliales bacterium]|nr:L-threonylcarbamoyladenylate synthase [Candidatus Babeliales bacterium]
MNSKMLHWNNVRDWQTVASLLKQDKVLVGASDTVIGLLAPVTKKGFERLNHIKQRSGKPYLILVDSPKQAYAFARPHLPRSVQALIDRAWPGPVTLIIPAHDSLESFITSDLHAVAVRIPNHEGLRAVAKHFRGLFSTSANRAGDFVPTQIKDLNPEIVQEAAALIDGPIGDAFKKPSTILDCSGSKIKVVRQGAYPIEELEKIAGVMFVG